MKPLFIAGNWKSNKTSTEAIQWLRNFQFSMSNVQLQSTTIILCVPFTLLSILGEEIKKLSLPIALGAQDVSPFGEGAYTGAVSARQIKEFSDWVMIGHSERRKYFSESDEMLSQKVTLAKAAGLNIIYCVPDDQTAVPQNAGIDVVAYEPVWAIGSGKADTAENANTVIASVKQTSGSSRVLYGGSVSPENVGSFVTQSAIDGVLVGGASLDAEKFLALIQAVCSQN